MKLNIGSILVLLFCLVTANFSGMAMGSASLELAEVICIESPGSQVSFNMTLNLPLANDDGAGGDYLITYFYEDFQFLSAGGTAWTADSTYPWTGSIGFMSTQASSVSVILVDEVGWNVDGPFDYASVMSSEKVLAEITINLDDYCDFSESESSGESSDIVMPPDSRINWQYGDLNAVLYRSEDGQGHPALNLYCYDGERSWLGFQITSENVEEAPIEANGCDVTFYILESGELQLNIRDAEGKLYEIICADLACENPVMRYFDPNE